MVVSWSLLRQRIKHWGMLELLYLHHMKPLKLQLRRHLRNWFVSTLAKFSLAFMTTLVSYMVGSLFRLRGGRFPLWRNLSLHKSLRILTLPLRVGEFGLQPILFQPSLMTEVLFEFFLFFFLNQCFGIWWLRYSTTFLHYNLQVRSHAMLVCQCLPLWNKVTGWVMLSLFCGSSAAFPVTVPNLSRLVFCADILLNL